MSIPTTSIHPRVAAPCPPPAPNQAPVRPATSKAVRLPASPVTADPALVHRAARARQPLAAPSWKAFRMYAGNHPNLTELKSVGVSGMIRGHRGVRAALAIGLASVLIMLMALLAYWWLMPATADADSPYVTAETGAPESTPARAWKKGVVPSLYQTDSHWGSQPYGQGTIAAAGAVPTALTMAYVAVTGDQSLTPADFAAWGSAHDLTATGSDTIKAYLTDAGADHGLSLKSIALDEHALRRALVAHTPVLVVTQPGTFAPVASVIILDDIDRNSHLVIHDPTSPSRSAKGWKFDDVINAAAVAYEVHPA